MLQSYAVKTFNQGKEDGVLEVDKLKAELKRTQEALESEKKNTKRLQEEMTSPSSSNDLAGILDDFQRRLQKTLEASNKTLKETIVKEVKEDIGKVVEEKLQEKMDDISKSPHSDFELVKDWLDTCKE